MMVFLLEECNSSCKHCVREDEPMASGYKLSFKQLKTCLIDCQNLKTIEWVHFSGGEPTLWTDGKLDLVDILIEVSGAGFDPGFTTNGCHFVDYRDCCNFLKKYLDNANKRLRLYISIDTFHNNFDIDEGRAKSLDNVMKCKREMPSEKGKLLDITVIVTVSKDAKSLLPDEMVEHYRSHGVQFNFMPLEPKGKAKSFVHLCPDLRSNKAEDLGAFYPFLQAKMGGDMVSNLILIGDDYYLYNNDNSVEFTRRWYKVARLGNLVSR